MLGGEGVWDISNAETQRRREFPRGRVKRVPEGGDNVEASLSCNGLSD